MACVKSFGRAVHPPTEACGRVPQSTGSRRRLKPCIRPSEPLLNCRRDWFLVGGSESSDGRKLPAVTEAVTFSRHRKIPGWKGQPEDIRWRPRPPRIFTQINGLGAFATDPFFFGHADVTADVSGFTRSGIRWAPVLQASLSSHPGIKQLAVVQRRPRDGLGLDRAWQSQSSPTERASA